MSFKEILPIILNVLKDPRVIATAIAMLLVMEFARFVANYRKKAPHPVKLKKTVTHTPKVEPPAESESGGEEEATEN